MITIIIIIEKYKVIVLIDRERTFSNIIILLVKEIKDYLKIKYRLNTK